MKKLFNVLMMLVLVLALCACTPSENTDPDDDSENSNTLTESYVSLDINPSIEIIVSSDGKVVTVYAKNDDAKVLLVGEVTFVGQTLEEAVKRITDLCIEYGYLTEENKDIEVSVSSPDGEEMVESLENKVNQAITEETKDLDFSVVITTGLTEEMMARYEEVKAQLVEEGLVEELSIHKFKLMESAQSSDPTLEVEVAVTLNEEELINRIKASRDEAYNIATSTYNKMVEEVEKTSQKIKKSFERGKYAAFYTANMMKHMVNYGALYAMYGAAADTSEAVLELQSVFDETLKNVLTEEQIASIVSKITELDIAYEQVKEGIKDENGNVTVDSINLYLDEILASVENEEVKAQVAEIREILAGIEEAIKEQAGALEEKYIPQLEVMLSTLKMSFETFDSAYKMIQAIIPQSVKDAMTEFLAETELLITTIETTLKNNPKVEDLALWVETFRAKEAELYDKIVKDLSEEELDKIENGVDFEIPAEFKEAEENLTKIRDEAKSAVEEELKKIKEDRKPKEETPQE